MKTERHGLGPRRHSRLLRWLACAAIGLGGSLAAAGAAAARVNVLFILADDLGYGDVGCYGAPDIRTPNLDRLARQGVRLTDFYANGPTCSPTRYALMTGRYQQRGGLEYALNYQEMDAGLPPGGETLASRLRKAGYKTALIGKWHLGYQPDRAPNGQGFDYFFGLLGGNHHYFTHVDRKGVHDLFLNGALVERPGKYSTDLFTETAIDYLREKKDAPFFLFLAYNAPHFPFQGPRDGARDVRPNTKEWSLGTRAQYVSMVEHLDQGIGRVLEALDKQALAENTLVVFASDNGGDPRGRNRPLRGEKGDVWEGGIRVPCIARFPGRIQAGSTSSQVGITMDWTQSILTLAGSPIPDADGRDILPALTGRAPAEPRILFWRRMPEPIRKAVNRSRAVREGPWKLVQGPDRSAVLFDLSSDMSESRNVAADHPDRVARLLEKLDQWEKSMPASNPPTF